MFEPLRLFALHDLVGELPAEDLNLSKILTVGLVRMLRGRSRCSEWSDAAEFEATRLAAMRPAAVSQVEVL